VTDSKNKKTYEVFSQPIKVISKRNQAKRMIAKNELLPTDPIPPPKRVTSDQITESLARLEAQQREQAKLIQLLVAREQNQVLAKVEPISQVNNCQTPSKKRKLDNSGTFEEAFSSFLDSFRRVPQAERSNKLRRVLQSFSTDLETLNDFAKNYSEVVACLAPSSPYSDEFSSPAREDFMESSTMFDGHSFDPAGASGTVVNSCHDDLEGNSLSTNNMNRFLGVDVCAL